MEAYITADMADILHRASILGQGTGHMSPRDRDSHVTRQNPGADSLPALI